MRLGFLAVLVAMLVSVSLLDDAVAFGGGGGDGCCGGDAPGAWWESFVGRLAQNRGEDASMADQVYKDLSSRPYEELYHYKSIEYPCDAYQSCETLTNEFVKELVEIAMKYQEIQQPRNWSWWATMAAVASALVSIAALVLSLLAMSRSAKKNESVA